MFRLLIRNTSKEETWLPKKRKIIGKGIEGFMMTTKNLLEKWVTYNFNIKATKF